MSEADADRSETHLPVAKPRQISWLWFLLAVAGVCLYLQLMSGRSRHGADGIGANHPAVGRHLPELRLQALTGESQDVTLAELAGDVVVVNFWGTWCPPCREEFPELAAMWVQLRSREHFRFLAVSCPYDDDDSDLTTLRKETARFLDQKQSQLPTYSDRSAFTRRNVAMVLDDSRFGYPTTIVLDQNGVIRGAWTQYVPGIADQIKQLVGELLGAKS